MARIMELVNAVYKYDTIENPDKGFLKNVLVTLIKLLAPLAPHSCEEWFEQMGNKPSVFLQHYPEFDSSKLVKDEVELAVQINGKLRGKIVVSASATEQEIKKAVFDDEYIAKLIDGKTPKKVIVIPKRIVNIVL